MVLSTILPMFRTTAHCDAPPPPPPALPAIGDSAAAKSAAESNSDSSASTSSASAPPPPPEDDAIARAAQSVSSCPNPGPLDMATYDVRRLTSLDTYDGFRCDISKQLSPYFACVHSFHLGTTCLPEGKNASYSFSTNFNDEEGFMMARVDPERGSVDGRIHKALLGGLAMGKIQVSLSSEGQNDMVQGDLDVGAQTWTANLKYGSMGGANMFGCNYLQSVSPRLQMGGEGMYIGANGALMSSYTAKLLFPDGPGADGGDAPAAAAPPQGPPEAPTYLAATYNAGQGALTLNYKRAVTPGRVTVGAMLECSPVTLESQAAVGAEFSLTRSKMNVCVDSSGRIQSVLESKLGREPGGPALSFAAELDHGKNVMKFGYGLNIGS